MPRYLTRFTLLILFIVLPACAPSNIDSTSNTDAASEVETDEPALGKGAERAVPAAEEAGQADPESTPEGVERLEPEPDAATTASDAVLQTQPGPRGVEVDLRRAEVTGDILTVEVVYRNPTDRYRSAVYKPDKVSIIDDATSKRYDVLQDDTERYMASPLSPTDSISLNPAPKGGSAIGWFKFPAPPPSSQTISVNIPDVGAFTGVPVQR